MSFLDSIFTSASNLVKTTAPVVNLVNSGISKLKETFLPTPEVAAQRRKEVFGTESKAVAASAITVAGVAAIAAAPGVVGSAVRTGVVAAAKKILPGVLSTGSSLGKTVVQTGIKYPVATTLGLGLGGSAVLGAVSTNPSIVLSAPKESFKLGQKVGTFIKENPTESALIGAAGLIGGTLAAAEIAASKSKDEINNYIPSAPDTADLNARTLPTTPSVSQIVPTTPPTQVIGKEVSTTRRKYSKRKTVKQQPNSIKINIVNDSYLKRSTYTY